LNRHSFLQGNDPAATDGRLRRGQRVFCSNRGQRGGFGRTFSIYFAAILPRHTVSATMLWKLLGRLLAGVSTKSAAQSYACPLSWRPFTIFCIGCRCAWMPDALSPTAGKPGQTLFTFIRHPEAMPTNNQAEQSLQPSVILRKLTFGNRSPAGARHYSVLSSLLITAHRQGRDARTARLALFTQPASAAKNAFYHDSS